MGGGDSRWKPDSSQTCPARRVSFPAPFLGCNGSKTIIPLFPQCSNGGHCVGFHFWDPVPSLKLTWKAKEGPYKDHSPFKGGRNRGSGLQVQCTGCRVFGLEVPLPQSRQAALYLFRAECFSWMKLPDVG